MIDLIIHGNRRALLSKQQFALLFTSAKRSSPDILGVLAKKSPEYIFERGLFLLYCTDLTELALRVAIFLIKAYPYFVLGKFLKTMVQLKLWTSVSKVTIDIITERIEST